MDSNMEPRLQELGYTDFKMSYLTFLANIDEGGTTNNELARKAGVTKQMMSKTVSLLENDGYIFTRKNPADSRSSIIFLNERGKKLFNTLRETMQDVRSKFDDIVGHDRMEQVIDTLAELDRVLDEVAMGVHVDAKLQQPLRVVDELLQYDHRAYIAVVEVLGDLIMDR